MIRAGVVEHITNHSGHYQPTIKHLLNVVGELLDRGHPLRKDVAITISNQPPDIALADLLRRHKPEWLPRIGVRP